MGVNAQPDDSHQNVDLLHHHHHVYQCQQSVLCLIYALFQYFAVSNLHVIVITPTDIPFIITVFCDVVPCRLVEIYPAFQSNLLPPTYC
jgi:hypothetical protein